MNIHNLFTFLRTEQQKDLIYYTLMWDNFNMVSENVYITFIYSLYKQYKRKRAKIEYITVDTFVGLI